MIVIVVVAFLLPHLALKVVLPLLLSLLVLLLLSSLLSRFTILVNYYKITLTATINFIISRFILVMFSCLIC